MNLSVGPRWILALGLLLVVAVETQAAAKSKKKRSKGHSHSHSHSHDHGHGHAAGGFTFGAGLTMTQGFGSSAGGEDGGSEAEHGHSHGLTGDDELYLDEGHSHDGGEEAEGGESGTSGPSTSLIVTAGYRLTSALSMNLGLSYGLDSGIGDPTLGVGHTMKLGKGTSLGSTLSASAPVSEFSRDNYKITTISLGSGPSWSRGKFLVSARGSLAKTYYSKTIVVEEADDHEHEEGTTLTRGRGGFSLQEDEHEEEHEHTLEGGTGDREFDRYSLAGNLAYRLSKRWGVGTGLGLSYVTHQFGTVTYETTATVVAATYSFKMFAASLGLLTSAAGESPEAPTSPGFSAGIFYTYE